MKGRPTTIKDEKITNKELYKMIVDLRSQLSLIAIDAKKSRDWFRIYVKLLIVLITVGISLGGIIIYLEIK